MLKVVVSSLLMIMLSAIYSNTGFGGGKPEALKLTTIKVTAVGDCTLGSDPSFGYEDTLPYVVDLKGGDLSNLFKNVQHIFEEDDITIINLETTFTEQQQRAEKTFTFKGTPLYAHALAKSSIEAVNLANNHTYDFLLPGYKDTVDALRAAKINYFDDDTICIQEVKGIKIALLGYNALGYDNSLYERIRNDISRLRNDVSVIIVSFHWGIERQYYPDNNQTSLAHHTIDCGADLVIGHHPHVLQGIECYNKRLISYSLGNFCFGGNVNPSDKETMILQVNFNLIGKKLKNFEVKVIPCRISSVNYINDYCPTPAEDEDAKQILRKINTLSPDAGRTLENNFIKVAI